MIDFHVVLKSMGFDTYKQYLASEHWRAVKNLYRQSDVLKVCFVCGNKQYELHHKSYENLGREQLCDLVPLCRKCHQLTHDAQKAEILVLDQAHEYVKKHGKIKLKESFEPPRCFDCSVKCYVHENRFQHEVRIFNCHGLRWMCHDCRPNHGLPKVIVKKAGGKWKATC